MLENPIVILTREDEDNGPLLTILKKKGIKTIEYQCIKTRIIPYKDEKIKGNKRLMYFDVLVFTSKRGVYGMAEVYQQIYSSNQLIAAVGEKTAEVIEQRIGRKADLVAHPQNSRALAKLLLTKIKPGDRILHIRGNKTSGILKQILEKKGFLLHELIVYKHELPEMQPLKVYQNAIVVFASPSAVSNFFKTNDVNKIKFYISTGPITSNHLKKLNIPRVSEAITPNPEGIVDKILQIYNGGKKIP